MKKCVLVSLFLLLTACKEQILHNLQEEEANRVVTHLHDAGIDADKVNQSDGLWMISVSEEKSAEALKYLAEARTFRRESFSTHTKGSLLRGREEQRFFFERALSQELESTLTSLSGTLDARVHLNIPEKDPLLGRTLSQDDHGSGSVLLVVREPYSKAQKERIAQLVSGASGIPEKNISVLISQEELQPEKPSETAPGGVLQSKDLDMKQLSSNVEPVISQASLGWLLFAIGAVLLLVCFFVLPGKRRAEMSNIFGGFS